MADMILQEKTEDGILILTLNRPEAMNCFNSDLLSALAEAIQDRLEGPREPAPPAPAL